MPKRTPSRADLALDNCDKEPIHIPGRIQAHGVLLAADLNLEAIDYASENAEGWLGLAMVDVLAQPVGSVLGDYATAAIRSELLNPSIRAMRRRVSSIPAPGSPGASLDVYVHINVQDLAVIELERSDSDAVPETAGSDLHELLGRVISDDPVVNNLQQATLGLRKLTGYDRVMAYRCEPNGDGVVVAESRVADIKGFLGHRFPSWDIPRQARAMLLRTPLRLISDTGAEPVAVLARTDTAASLDQSLCHLRGTSPIHLEYLGNMGLGATMTISLVVDGSLWGLLAFHHREPHVPTSSARLTCELFSRTFPLLLGQQLEGERRRGRHRAAEARRRILAETDAATDLLASFHEVAPILMSVIDCDGLAVEREGKVFTRGTCPTRSVIDRIAGRSPDEADLIDCTEQLLSWELHQTREELMQSAGAMIVRATASYPLQVLFFRNETLVDISWAGRPDKIVETGPMGPRLTPRGSFDAYVESNRERSRPWRLEDRAAAVDLQILLTQLTARDERAQLQRQEALVAHRRQQELLIAELNHRVKNILALIQSLSRQARTSSTSLENYAHALEKRIAALAAAHDLAVARSMRGVPLKRMLETELEPYFLNGGGRVLLAGPPVGLRPDVAPMIALVFHELATNANKHGALSNDGGLVRVMWSLDEEGLSGTWQEFGGPPVAPSRRKGFGRSLIDRAIPYEFEGTAELVFDPGGVRFAFSLPSRTLITLEGSEEPPSPRRNRDVAPTESAGERPLESQSLLLVEDNVLLAMDMADTLTSLGASSVYTAANTQSALDYLQSSTVDVGVLDMNLSGKVSFDVAEALKAQSIPFVFVTGYGSDVDMPAEFNECSVLTKPIDRGALARAIGALL